MAWTWPGWRMQRSPSTPTLWVSYLHATADPPEATSLPSELPSSSRDSAYQAAYIIPPLDLCTAVPRPIDMEQRDYWGRFALLDISAVCCRTLKRMGGPRHKAL